MNDEWADESARIIREEIDKEVVVKIRVQQLLSQGWTRVVINIPDHEGIGPWMQANMRGDWRGFYNIWMFEDADDATLFKMRWS